MVFPVGKGRAHGNLSSPSVVGHFLEGPLGDCRGIHEGKSVGLDTGDQIGMGGGALIASSSWFLAPCVTAFTSTQADIPASGRATLHSQASGPVWPGSLVGNSACFGSLTNKHTSYRLCPMVPWAGKQIRRLTEGWIQPPAPFSQET